MAKPFAVVDGAVRTAPYQYVCVDGVWRRVRYGFGVVDGGLRQEWSAADIIPQPDFDATVEVTLPFALDNNYTRYPYVDITDYAWLTASYIVEHTGYHPAANPPQLDVSILLVNTGGGHTGTTIYLSTGLQAVGTTNRDDVVVDLRHLKGDHRMAFNMFTKNQPVENVKSTCRMRVSNMQFIPE